MNDIISKKVILQNSSFRRSFDNYPGEVEEPNLRLQRDAARRRAPEACRSLNGDINMTNTSNDDKGELDSNHSSSFGMEDADDLGVSDAISEFKQLDYGFLVPFKKIFSKDLLRKKAVRWVLFFGLLPLIISWVSATFECDDLTVLWFFQLYFCLFWALYFYSIINPSKVTWWRGIHFAFFTVVTGIPTLLALYSVPIIGDLYAGIESDNFIVRFMGNILVVGVLEEFCKAFPLIWLGLRKNKLNGVREGIFLGLMSGLGFAAAEGVIYTFFASITAVDSGVVGGQVLTLLDRAITAPLQHGAWAGVAGWFIGVASLRNGKKWPVVAVGIGLVAMLHGIYNLFADGLIGIVIAAVGYLVFMGYLIHGVSEGPLTQQSQDTVSSDQNINKDEDKSA